jgi:hypothetical protein
MRRLVQASALAIGIALLVPAVFSAQQDPDKKVAGGGITAKGWQGKIDAGAAGKGMTVNDSKFGQEGGALRMAVGPAAIYWNPANTATGDYTVKATFKEAKPDAGHPHPYGIFIGGTKLDTDQHTLVYCAAYSTGEYLVRGFSSGKVVTLSKRAPNAAVNKTGPDGSVTQEIAWTVKGGKAECLINGTSVASFEKDAIVGAGKLDSTDGIYGIRVSHNIPDLTVTGLGKS